MSMRTIINFVRGGANVASWSRGSEGWNRSIVFKEVDWIVATGMKRHRQITYIYIYTRGVKDGLKIYKWIAQNSGCNDLQALEP